MNLELSKLGFDRLRTIQRNSKDPARDLFDHPVFRQSAPSRDIAGVGIREYRKYEGGIYCVTPKLPDTLTDFDDQSRADEPSKGPHGRGQRRTPGHRCITVVRTGRPKACRCAYASVVLMRSLRLSLWAVPPLPTRLRHWSASGPSHPRRTAPRRRGPRKVLPRTEVVVRNLQCAGSRIGRVLAGRFRLDRVSGTSSPK